MLSAIFQAVLKRLGDHAVLSYSQEGEDMILRRVFENRPRGFYVEVGAPHPTRFSNSYYFYKQGWNGINIDATPDSMSLFRNMRPRDVNLEFAISQEKETRDFFIFNDPALNTFDEKLARESEDCGYHILATKRLATHTLAEILAEYVPEGQRIDFLSIDVEGMDFAVIRSNDWRRFRPVILLVEMLGVSIEGARDLEMYNYLVQEGYDLFAKCVNTFLFQDRSNS